MGRSRAAWVPRTGKAETAVSEAAGPPGSRFRRTFFPGIDARTWSDWRWQMRNRLRDLAAIERILHLTDDERRAVERHGRGLPTAITPYYASLLSRDDPLQPLRRTMIVDEHEFDRASADSDDPLEEEGDRPVPGLIHRYPDRVVLLVTNSCFVYCRYCTRSRLVGRADESRRLQQQAQWQIALDHIAATPTIRDVLLSGGDPLLLSDDRLQWLLSRLRSIPHVEFLRIGTKAPAALPQRITPALVRMLRKFHPLWMSLHFCHPDELTPEAERACARLADAGIPLGSQTVLLRGVNDDLATLRTLFQGLVRMRVKPYYLFQCDHVSGTSHFQTPLRAGLEILRGLRGFTSGYAVPTFVVDLPGGGGKIPLLPEYVVGTEGRTVVFRNYAGELFRFVDSDSTRDPSVERPARVRA